MKPENFIKQWASAFVITCKTVIHLLALAALVLSVTPQAGATLMDISFDDGGNNVGCGVIDVEGGYAVSGDFVVTAGLASGCWALAVGTPSTPGSGSSPDGYFNYDNMVFPGSDPYLTTSGGLLFTNCSGDEINIWADAPDTYCLWAVNSSGVYYVQAGSYPGYSSATGFGASTITNSPEPMAAFTQASPPTLSIQPATNGFTLLWPASGTIFRVLQNTDLTTTNWVASTNAVSLATGTNQIVMPPNSGNMFFQLVSP
jgi:hypothetical protein